MEEEAKKTTLRQRFKNTNKTFAGITITWLLILLLLSVGEVIFNGVTLGYAEDVTASFLWSALYSYLFWLHSIVILYGIYLFLAIFKTRIANIALIIILSIATVTQLGLIQYFNTAFVPLGADVYGYSIEDIKQTVGASGGIGFISILLMIVVVALVVLAFNFSVKKLKPSFKIAIALPILSLLVWNQNLDRKITPKKFDTEFSDNLILHKTDFFIKSSYDHFYPEDYDIDIYAESYIQSKKKKTKLSYEYLDEQNYPFLRKDNTPDVLSSFLNKSDKKPNIVLILVEGLGRAFTNEGAYLGNFTPYLDSLSTKSLYWKNFLSQGGRTFAVLPSITASLPFGNGGFMALGKKMPNHFSLFNILKANGYHTSFYYGGESKFDNMKLFLQKNKVDVINDYDSFPAGATKLPDNNGFSWGYSDKALFKHYLNTCKTNKPKFSVMLTIAMHSPFLIEQQEYYNQKFENRLDKLDFSAKEKSKHRKHKKQYASILYADDAIKEFISNYQKKEDFKNTIFLITGDHRLPEIPMSTKLDRYHVPLIVYSPMLKRAKEISSISTHWDVTPSLISYLKNSYQLKTPKYVSWAGDGLDTIQVFQNNHSYALKQTKSDLRDFIQDTYHLSGKKIYELDEELNEIPLEDNDLMNQLTKSFNAYKIKNKQVDYGSKIIPDTIFKKHIKF